VGKTISIDGEGFDFHRNQSVWERGYLSRVWVLCLCSSREIKNKLAGRILVPKIKYKIWSWVWAWDIESGSAMVCRPRKLSWPAVLYSLGFCENISFFRKKYFTNMLNKNDLYNCDVWL
jgi:hypothetical protein